jgi:hypothetical protein
MKTSILGILLVLTSAVSWADTNTTAEPGQPMHIFHCDNKKNDWTSEIYSQENYFYICMGNDPSCMHKIYSEGWNLTDEVLKIDFHDGWMFDGTTHSGILSRGYSEYLCERVIVTPH